MIALVKVPNYAKYGVTDSAGRRSHMAYPQNGAYPATHPTATVKSIDPDVIMNQVVAAVSSGAVRIMHTGSIIITNAVDMNHRC